MLKLLKQLVVVFLWSLLFPLCLHAEEVQMQLPDKPVVPDSILQNIFQFAPFYSKIVDEYKADLYLKGRLRVHKTNKLVKYIPSMFRLEEGINDYIIESMSEMHYTAPDIYNRKVKAVSSTFSPFISKISSPTFKVVLALLSI